jgi:hypothetical protein
MVMIKKKPAPEEPNKRHKTIALVIAALICLVGICTFLYGRSNSADDIKKDMAKIDGNKDLSREEREDAKRQFYKNLSQGEQKALRDDRMNEWRKRENERLAAFFKKTPQEQKKQLREEIQRQEERRKEREAWMAANGMNGPGGQGGAGGPNGQGGPQNAGQGGAGGRRGGDPDQRQQRRDEFIQRFTPEEREQRNEYRYQLNHERVSMGLPPVGGGGPRGGPGFGRGGPPR